MTNFVEFEASITDVGKKLALIEQIVVENPALIVVENPALPMGTVVLGIGVGKTIVPAVVVVKTPA